MREHAFEFDVLQVQYGTDAVEVLGVEPVAVHAGVDFDVGLACGTGFSQELVEQLGGAEVRNGGGQLKFYEVGEVGRRAGAEYQDGQVHAVLAQQHAFANMGDTKIVGTAELGGEGTGETAVSVRVGFDRKQNLRIGGDLAPDELDVVAQGV